MKILEAIASYTDTIRKSVFSINADTPPGTSQPDQRLNNSTNSLDSNEDNVTHFVVAVRYLMFDGCDTL